MDKIQVIGWSVVKEATPNDKANGQKDKIIAPLFVDHHGNYYYPNITGFKSLESGLVAKKD